MAAKVTLTIDGREVTAPAGEKLLWVALDHGIYIPHLCAFREEERPAASCRLCLVEVAGFRAPVAACALTVAAGMVVQTRSPRVDRLVRRAFALLLSRHRLACGQCPRNGDCALQEIARRRGLKLRREPLPPLDHDLPVDNSPATFYYDPGRCVLCGRCVWVCRHRAGVGAIGFVGRGLNRRVSTFGDVPLAHSSCTECGACVSVCPVGALVAKPAS